VEDYGSGIPLAEGPRGCFLVVPAPARAWLEEHKDLCDYLAREGRVAWEDEWVAVYELEPLAADGGRIGAREVRRASLQPLRGISPSELPAAFFEAPADGALLPAHAVMVSGWVVGDDGLAAAIEFEHAGEVVWRTPVGGERSDVVAAFPDAEVGRPGFQTTLNACDLPPGAQVGVFALFGGGRRVAIADLTLGEPDGAVEAGGDG
jgi:hypothetical protein